ncbi:MAG: hypothetical protein FWF57_03470 [Defluviitaleaceae bacterium]|nr:hypothetical protein [Defluviitaleaceae bacterium]
MNPLDIILIIIAVVTVLGGGLYFLARWSQSKVSEQQKLISSTSQTISIYVIDKKRDNIKNAGLPKMVTDQMPKRANLMKMYFVKAKVGPQIMTFMCEKQVFHALPLKKNIKVDASGIYITNMKGMKTKEEMKKLKKAKKENNKKSN